MNTIQSEWDRFQKLTIPGDENPEDIRIARKIFYSGAAAALDIAINASSGKFTEEAGSAIVRGLLTEIESFVREIENGGDQ